MEKYGIVMRTGCTEFTDIRMQEIRQPRRFLTIMDCGDFDYPDGADILITGAADISQVTETLEADAQKENSSGYYIIDMPKDAKIDTISIPAGVKGVTFWGPYQYNEETDTRVHISCEDWNCADTGRTDHHTF